MFDQPVSKSYVWGTLGWIVGFLLAINAVGKYSESMPAGSPARIALALSPLILLAFAFRLDLGFYRRLDEMQRQIMLECMVIAAYAVTAVCAVGLMLEELGGVPRMSPLWVIGASGLASVLGWLYLRRKYR